MKWAATEKVKGVRDYTKGDQIRAKFDSWNIPLSGNTLLWEVDHKATPQWYKNEINALIDAGEDTEPLSEHVLFHVQGWLCMRTNHSIFLDANLNSGYC